MALTLILLSLIGTVVKMAMIRTTVQGFLGLQPIGNVNLWAHLKRGVAALPTVLLWYLLFIAGWLVYSIGVFIVVFVVMIITAILFSGSGNSEDDSAGDFSPKNGTVSIF